jgi:glycosyltransferase involved in cell wall biosynthesis
MAYSQRKLLIATTVPETLATILQGQPERLSEHFETAVVSSAGAHMNDVQASERFTVNMNRGMSPLADVKSIFLMMRVIRLFKPDIIHSYTPKAGLVCMVAGFLCRAHVRVHTFTGLIFPTTTNRFKRFVLKRVDALICACATTVVAEGVGVRNDLVRFKVTRKPIQIIGHGNIAGLDSSYFDPRLPVVKQAVAELDSTLPLLPENFIFLYVGRLNRDKGLKELASAFVALDDHNALKGRAVLWIVGSLDQTSPPDAATMQVLNAHPHVIQMGFLKDIRGALSRCDVLVLPSYREGFPNVLMQAGVMLKPVIATDINGSNEIVVPGETGWLVPAKDTLALKQAMVHAMQTSLNDRVAMGLLARDRIQKLYERELYIKVLESFYQSLTKQTHLSNLTNPNKPNA